MTKKELNNYKILDELMDIANNTKNPKRIRDEAINIILKYFKHLLIWTTEPKKKEKKKERGKKKEQATDKKKRQVKNGKNS